MPIVYARERRIMLEAVLQLREEVANHYFPQLKGRQRRRQLDIMAVILLGHIKGRPATALSLAKTLGSPRTTVIRQLRSLIRFGVVVQIKNGYCVTEVANSPGAIAMVQRSIALFVATAKKLTASS